MNEEGGGRGDEKIIKEKVYVMTRGSIEEMLRVCMCMYVYRSEDVKEV